MNIKPHYDPGMKVKVSGDYFIRKAMLIPRDCTGIIMKWEINNNDALCRYGMYTVKLLETGLHLDDVRVTELKAINEFGDTDGDCVVTDKFKIGDEVLVSVNYFVRANKKLPDLKGRYAVIADIVHRNGNPLTLNPVRYAMYKIKFDNPSDKFYHYAYENELIATWFNKVKTALKKKQKDLVEIKTQPQINYKQPFGLSYYTAVPSLLDSVWQLKIPAQTTELAKEELKIMLENENSNTNVVIPEIDRVIFSNPATIILWKAYHYEKRPSKEPNTIETVKVQDKTIVKCAPGEKFSKYNGFCAAVAKYVFGTNSNITRIVKNAQDDYSNPKVETLTKDQNAEKNKDPDKCKYYTARCGRKYTCKTVYDCDGTCDKTCKEYLKNEKKTKGGKKK